jgi:hypothetical protein
MNILAAWLEGNKYTLEDNVLTLTLHECTDNSPVPKSLALSDRPTFTFIDHDEDLASKQITGANARKAIRSHVMRDVRRRERLAGRKRPSKRGERAGPDSAKSTGSSSRKTSPTEASYRRKEDKDDGRMRAVLRLHPSRSFSPSSASSASVTEPSSAITPSSDLTLTSKLRGKGTDLHISKEKIHELSAELFDPFFCLPGADDLPYIIETLVQYCEYKVLFLILVIGHDRWSRVLFFSLFWSIGYSQLHIRERTSENTRFAAWDVVLTTWP